MLMSLNPGITLHASHICQAQAHFRGRVAWSSELHEHGLPGSS